MKKLFAAVTMTVALAAPAIAADPIRIGVLTVDAGPFAFFQAHYTEPMKLAVERINATGGVLGRPLELVMQAHAGTPAAALGAVSRLAQQEKVSFITGFNTSSIALAAGPRMAGLNAILLDVASASDEVVSKSCNSHYFRSSSTDAMAMAVLRSLVKDSGIKTWSTIGQDYAMGHDFAKQFDAVAKEAGAAAQPAVLVPVGTTDFGSQIAQLAAKGSEGLAVTVAGSDGIALAKQQQQFGLFKKYKMVVSNNFTNEIALPAQGDSTVGVYSAMPHVRDMPGAKNAEVVKLFQEKLKRPISTLEAEAWQGIEILRAAIEQARSTDVMAVRNALAKLKTTTIFGEVEMRPDHQLQRPMALVQVEEAGPGKARVATRKILPAAAIAPPVMQNCN